MSSNDPLRAWATRLRSVASRGLGAPAPTDLDERLAWIESFRDESGGRTDAVVPLLLWTLGGRREAPQGELDSDAALWWATVDPGIRVERSFSRDAGAALLAHAPDTPIEIWTERELCGLHALWWLVREWRRPEWRALCVASAERLVRTIQPDNATGHPWGVHVFARLGATGELGPDADVYAQTLLHNCQVQLGRPDRVSAYILLDAARELDRPA